MTCSKLRILIYLTISLTLLFAPVLLEISQDGKTYAFSSRSHNKSSNTGDKETHGYTPVNDEPPNNTTPPAPVPDNTTPPAPVPEPATMLLVGGGALGLAALRKKFKKK